MNDNVSDRKALKRLFKVINGSTPKSDVNSYWDGDIVWVTPEDIGRMQGNNIEDSRRHITNEGLASCGASMVPAASIILSTRAPIGNAAIADIPLCTNQGCKALVPRSSDVRTKFFFYQIQALKTELNVLGNGTTFLELNSDKLGQVRLFAPLPQAQSVIANFLDRETAEADALVAKYERLIELLEERRVALVTQAVTKGLDADAKMMDSGVSWLGHIPWHWNAFRVKFAATKIGSGITPRGGSESYVPAGVALLRSQNVYDDGLRLEDVAYIDEKTDLEMSRTRVKSGDVLLNITGASIGRTCIAPKSVLPANVNQHVCIIRPSREVLPEYLSYVLKSRLIRRQILSMENGSSREGLNYDQVGNLCFALPSSTDEQSTIVNYLDRELGRISALNQSVTRAIKYVKEHRSALIAAAVNGRIDVENYRSEKPTAEVSA